MAATKTRDRSYPRTEFSIPLAEALALLLDPREIAPGDRWKFRVIDGETLGIERERTPVDLPVNVAGATGVAKLGSRA